METESTEKGGRVAPIQLGQVDKEKLRHITIAFGTQFAGHDYRWQQLKAHSLPRIYAKDATTKNEMTEWLIRNGVEFNSYTEKDNRHRAYIVRGLTHGEDATNYTLIADALRPVGLDNGVRIERHVTGYMKRNPIHTHTPHYIESRSHPVLLTVTSVPFDKLANAEWSSKR